MDDLPALTAGQSAALARFAAAHGPGWKDDLRAAWMSASAEPVLHRLRNTHGPAWLDRFALDRPAAPDFTAYADPALAVPCPICRQAPGAGCIRSDGLRALRLHAERAAAADRAFLEQHGLAAVLDLEPGGWVIDPQGRARD